MSGTPRIMIDGYNLGLRKGTGVATYARNLSFHLHDLGYAVDVLYGAKLAPSYDPLLREISFFDPPALNRAWHRRALRRAWHLLQPPWGIRAADVPMTGAVVAGARKDHLPYFDRVLNATDAFNRGARHFRTYGSLLDVTVPQAPALMHWTYPLPLRVPGARNIYTLHDLVPLRLPYAIDNDKARYLRLITRLLEQADHIVTVSETSKRDIVSLFGTPPDKITNTFQSVEIPVELMATPEEIVRREVEGVFNLKSGGYFLFFGAIEPKKNVGRLIEGYLASQSRTPLVIVGEKAWMAEGELRLLKDQTLQAFEAASGGSFARERVMLLEYAPFPLLVSLIRAAKAVLYPSIYEGFGLPVLEAMTLGTPVLSSTQGSIPEIAGDAALLVDPYDARAIAEAILALDADADLRGTLAARGRLQAQAFAPERYRERLAEMYARLAGGSRSTGSA